MLRTANAQPFWPASCSTFTAYGGGLGGCFGKRVGRGSTRAPIGRYIVVGTGGGLADQGGIIAEALLEAVRRALFKRLAPHDALHMHTHPAHKGPACTVKERWSPHPTLTLKERWSPHPLTFKNRNAGATHACILLHSLLHHHWHHPSRRHHHLQYQ